MVVVPCLSFGSSTNSIREGPLIKLVKKLIELGVHVEIHDSKALDRTENLLDTSVRYCNDSYRYIKGVGVITIVISWSEYYNFDPEEPEACTELPLITDYRGIKTLR